jgi:hypothetical protein
VVFIHNLKPRRLRSSLVNLAGRGGATREIGTEFMPFDAKESLRAIMSFF